MYCTKCGTENEETDKVCKKCGADLGNEGIVHKKPISKIGICIFAIVVIGIIIAIQIYAGRPPGVDQITSDLQEEIKKDGDIVLYDTDYEIEELTVDKEEKEKKNYQAQIYVVYNNGRVEYKEKYVMYYYKNKKWEIKEIEGYEEETWEKKPLYAPTAQELLVDSMDYYVLNCDYQLNENATFVPSEKQEDPDLENGIAKFYYDISQETMFQKTTSKVEVTYLFEKNGEYWNCNNLTCVEEETEYDLFHTWSGIVEDGGGEKPRISIELTSIEGQDVNGRLCINDESHEMSGTITESGLDYEIKMQDINDESYYIRGYLREESGGFDVRVYTDYDPDAIFYLSSTIYDISLSKED